MIALGGGLYWREYGTLLKNPILLSTMHYKKLSHQRLLDKEKKGRQQAQVELQRSYRTGELPDIQITNADMIKHLRFLCTMDEVVAEKVMRSILTAVIQDRHPDSNVIEVLLKSANWKKLYSKRLTKCLMECCLAYVVFVSAYILSSGYDSTRRVQDPNAELVRVYACPLASFRQPHIICPSF